MNQTLDSLPLGRDRVFSDVCNNHILLGRVERKSGIVLWEDELMWILGNQGVHCNESVFSLFYIHPSLFLFVKGPQFWFAVLPRSPAHSHGGTVSLSVSPGSRD